MYQRRIYQLLIALIVSAVVFSLYSPVAQAQEEPSISLSAPTGISAWNLSPEVSQPNVQTGSLHVTVSGNFSGNWTVTASDTDTDTGGYLTRYNGSYVVTTKMGTPLVVQGPAGTATLPAGGNVVTGTGEVDQDFPISFRQNVAWTDLAGDYRIVVTFTGALQP